MRTMKWQFVRHLIVAILGFDSSKASSPKADPSFSFATVMKPSSSSSLKRILSASGSSGSSSKFILSAIFYTKLNFKPLSKGSALGDSSIESSSVYNVVGYYLFVSLVGSSFSSVS